MTPEQHESLKKLRTMALNDQLGATDLDGCIYVAGRRRCAVGALLSPDDAEYVVNNGLNQDVGAPTLLEELGLTSLGGFNGEQLHLLQNWHDQILAYDKSPEEYADFLEWLTEQTEPVTVRTAPRTSFTSSVTF